MCTDILGQILTLDLSHLEDSLPLLPESEMDIVIKTVGVMKHSDLPDTSLISPTHSGEVKHTTSSAVSRSTCYPLNLASSLIISLKNL